MQISGKKFSRHNFSSNSFARTCIKYFGFFLFMKLKAANFNSLNRNRTTNTRNSRRHTQKEFHFSEEEKGSTFCRVSLIRSHRLSKLQFTCRKKPKQFAYECFSSQSIEAFVYEKIARFVSS